MTRTTSVHQVMYGSEPKIPKNQVFMNIKDYNLFLHRSFDWYNNSVKDVEKKKWVVQWGVDRGFKSEEMKNIPESYLSTLGSMVRLQSNKFQFNQIHKDYLEHTIYKLINKFKSKSKPKPRKKVIKRGGVDNVALVMTDFDNALDAIFEKKNIVISIDYPLSAPNINELKTYYSKQLDYLEEDKDNHLYKNLLNKYKEILDILQKSVKVVIKKQRVKKPISKSKQVSKLNYMKIDNTLGVESINPEKIVGASKLIVFNTNNRKITIYNSIDDGGFMVKGSTLLNVDLDKSYCKTIRHPKIKLCEFVGITKAKTNRIFNDIKAVNGKVTGRINKHCLLVKVF